MAREKNIVILTGSGISAESGLATFRGDSGLWEGYPVEQVATPEAFQDDPELVQKFYNMRREKVQHAKPNDAHKALARLEKNHKGDVLIVTQNVDDLHERAGSKNILHMHGEVLKVRCLGCGDIHAWAEDLSQGTSCPSCKTKPGLRPHIVWFGEMPFHMEEIETALYTVDLFISIGTSGSVYPAAGFIANIKAMGKAHSVELNLEPSEGRTLFAEAEYGPATKIVPAYVEKLLKESV